MNQGAPYQLHNKHVLIIDDNEAILTTLGILLRARGLRVSTSNTAAIQPQLVGPERPDVILLDLQLGAGESGKEVCRSLKENNDTRDMVVIIMSANTDINEVATEAGADGCIAKPFAANELLHVMAQCVEAGSKEAPAEQNPEPVFASRYDTVRVLYGARFAN